MYFLYVFISSLVQSIQFGIASEIIVEDADNYTLCHTPGTVTLLRGSCYYSCSLHFKSFTSDENFICEEDGVTPLPCNNSGQCPVGTCEMVFCENEVGPSRCYKRKISRTRLCKAHLEKIKTVINYTLRMKASSSFTKRSFTIVDAILFAAAVVMAILLRYAIKKYQRKSRSVSSVSSADPSSIGTGGYNLIPRQSESSEPPSYSTVVESTDTSRETPPPTYSDVMKILNSKANEVT